MTPYLVLVVAGTIGVLGCRGGGKQAPTSERSVRGDARGGSGTTADAPGGQPAPASPGQGTDRLTNVPAEIGSQVKLERVARGFARPVLAVVAPGDARKRLFVVEQHVGRVRILEHGKPLPAPFLTIPNVSKANEQGLLGLAFHPAFATNRKLYVNYTDAEGDTRIVEYTVSATNPDQVDPESRRDLLTIGQPYSNHNGGHVLFGPDGRLYTGMGDGGSAGDPERNGQNPKALLGKILRIDVDAPRPQAEIVHMGVRNPWRFAFDVKTGDLFIADVGQNLWEYVFVVGGADKTKKNFGWNVIEGSHCYEAKTCDRSGFTLPVVEYPHDEGCSITGGYVYRGKALPALDGHYFYADFCTGILRSFRWTGRVTDHWEWKHAIDPGGELSQVSSFGVDHDGELLVVTLTGSIYKLVPA